MTEDPFTLSTTFIEVGDGHKVYVQEWGNDQIVIPIIYLHGGPGGGCSDKDKKKFDPNNQRVIFFDQRGTGRSEPYGKLENNTTNHLVGDISKIADHFKLDKFILVGGSWGSTLALTYAVINPDKVQALVLDGIFLGTKEEIDWLNKGGWRPFFPEIWKGYAESVPSSHAEDPSSYHFKKALEADDGEAKKSIYEVRKMELGLLKLDEIISSPSYDDFDPLSGKIEIFYMANNCFLEEDFIISNASKLTMPVYIIQGRFDMVCPPIFAFKLHEKLPHSHIYWAVSGHSKQHEAHNLQQIFLGLLAGEK